MTFYDQHNNLIKIDELETEEQFLAKKYIQADDIVLELGARYGTVSCAINKNLTNKRNQVVVEPGDRVWEALERNKRINGGEFHIVKGFISNKKLGLAEKDFWYGGYGTTAVVDESSTIPSYSLEEIKRTCNISQFNVLVADCEGFLESFLDENPTLIDSLRMMIFEADYPDKCNYVKIRKQLREKGFNSTHKTFQEVWVRSHVSNLETSLYSIPKKLLVPPSLPVVMENTLFTHKKKRLIVCADKQSPYEGGDSCLVHCVAMNESYAKQIGVDFKFVLLRETVEKRHPSWEKIRVVAKFVQEYDEILWFNSDAFVANRSVNAFDYIKTAPESEWKRDASIKPLLYTLSNKPWGSDLACTGIFLLDSSNKWAAAEVLNEWWSNVPDKRYEQEHPWEQSVWNNGWKNTPKASYLRVADVWSMSEKAEKQVFVHATDLYKNARLPLVKKYMCKQTNPPRAKKLGIIARQQSYYSNGAGQNCIFLMQSFEALGYDVDLLVYWKKENPQHVSDSYPIAYKDIALANFKEYEAILFGAQVPTAGDVERMKVAGVRRVMLYFSNVVDAFHNENFLYACRQESVPLHEMTFKDLSDEIWLIDTYKDISKTYLETINKHAIPVKIMPHVWSPLFLTNAHGIIPMNKPHSGKQLDIVIMEPNQSYCKSGWLPLIACEKIFLETPDRIHNVYFFNTPETNKTAMGMLDSLDLWKAKKLRIMKRLSILHILDFFSDPAKHGDHQVVFLSHAINSPLNYAYFDALYTGFPFVHNSPVLKERGIGYYYSNLEEAASAVRSVPTVFDAKDSLKKAHAMLADHDPYSGVCVKVFNELVK